MEVVARVGYAIHSGTQWRTVDTLRKGHTVAVGIEKIFQIQKGRSVSRLKPMVADLVGQ